jgi:hypothetical protein
MNDMSIISWRAWYSDRRRFDSTTTKWEDLPSDGVLHFVLYCKTRPYRRVMAGVSLYWHIPWKSIFACDNREDALGIDDLDVRWIKKGQWVSDQEYNDALREVTAAVEAPNEGDRVDR